VKTASPPTVAINQRGTRLLVSAIKIYLNKIKIFCFSQKENLSWLTFENDLIEEIARK